MSIGDIAGVIAALAFAYLVARLGGLVGKAGKVLDETRIGVRGISEQTVPLLSQVTETVASTNDQIVRLDTITANVSSMSTNMNALTSLFAATLGSPVVKVAAFTYGVRSALTGPKGRGARGRRRKG
ncbi:MAG: DUF948 domain-containing protein [Actinomycetota bacterium]